MKNQLLIHNNQGEKLGSDEINKILQDFYSSLKGKFEYPKSPNPFEYERANSESESKTLDRGIENIFPKKQITPQDKLINALASGEIPEMFIDQLSLLTKTDGIQPQLALIQKVLDRLWEHVGLSPDLKPRVFISDISEVNAMICTKAKPPILIITRGLLAESLTEDLLAGVIGHELGHIIIRNNFKLDSATNPEEATADVIGCKLMIKAGYNYQTLVEDLENQVAKNQQDKKSITANLLQCLFDPHPP